VSDQAHPERELRAELLAIAYRLLCLEGRQPAFPLEVRFRDSDGARTEYTFTRHEFHQSVAFYPPGTEVPISPPRAAQEPVPGPAPPGRAVSASAVLRQVHRKLLAKATERPTPAKQLIRAAGYPYNSYSREAVTRLCRQGLLLRTPDGVRLPPCQP
jgi:hypothetical protein